MNESYEIKLMAIIHHLQSSTINYHLKHVPEVLSNFKCIIAIKNKRLLVQTVHNTNIYICALKSCFISGSASF